MAGVSITTVSFVLNNKEPQVSGLSEETCKRVRACAAKLGYRRNAAAASLRSGKSLWVGVLIQPVRDEAEAVAWTPYELALISGVENALFDLGYFPVLGSKSTTGQTEALAALAQSGVSGLICRRPLREEVKKLEELREKGLACIAVFPARSSDLYPYQIDVDNIRAGDLGAELLCAAGCSRVAVITSGLFGHIEHDRIQGFFEGFEARCGKPPMICDVSDGRSDETRKRIMREFILEHKPDGILATEPGVSYLASFAADDAGVAVPNDMVLIGFDCFSFRSARRRVVSSITTSWWEAGRLAGRSVVELVQSQVEWDAPKKLAPRFIARDTTPSELTHADQHEWIPAQGT